jgi:hypothetical protein
MFIQIKDGQPFGYAVVEENLRMLYPNVTFPKVFFPSDVEPYGFGIYEFTQIPEVPRFKKLIEIDPVKRDNGIYYQTWGFEDMNEEEKIASTEVKTIEIKRQRNFNLMSSDWTQLPDVTLSEEKKTNWNNYRQSLRDISEQSGFPWDVIWPSQPYQII